MSCKHGNHPDSCDICDEVDAAYKSGIADGALAAPVAGAALSGELPRECSNCLAGKIKSPLTMMEQPCHICNSTGLCWPIKGLAAAIAQAPKAALTDDQIIATFKVNGLDVVRTVRAIEAATAPNANLVAALQKIVNNEISVFDEDVGSDVLVSMDAEEMIEIAIAALTDAGVKP